MLRKVRVSDHMLTHPVIATPDTDLFDAIHLIIVNKISGITVVDERRRPVGVLSELDCLKALLNAAYYNEEVGDHPIRHHMVGPVECIDANDDIIHVAQSMIDHKRRRRPVVDSAGVLIGQLTCRRILKAVKEFELPEDPSERLPR